jgi:hypothetical protein
MAKTEPSKDTGLRQGDAAKIARRHGVSRQHIAEVAAGRRPGRPAILTSIRRYQEKAKQVAA